MAKANHVVHQRQLYGSLVKEMQGRVRELDTDSLIDLLWSVATVPRGHGPLSSSEAAPGLDGTVSSQYDGGPGGNESASRIWAEFSDM